MTIEASDILSDGYVRMYRQRTDIPFIPDNILNIETTFQSLPRLHAAFTSAAKKEAELSAEMSRRVRSSAAQVLRYPHCSILKVFT